MGYWQTESDNFIATIEHYPSCNKRGPWKLLITHKGHLASSGYEWFPRWYFHLDTARQEAEAWISANEGGPNQNLFWQKKELAHDR